MIAVLRCLPGDGANRGLVVILDAPAERVRHQVLGEIANHRFRMIDERRAQAGRPRNRRAVIERRRRVDRCAAVLDPPRADDVEVLQCQAQGIDRLVARRARGILPVLLHVSQIYRFAIPQGWADQDPAAYLSDLLKPKPRTRHMARVGLGELPAPVRTIDRYDGEETPRRRAVTRAALLFTLLTWARTNETRLATWDEFEELAGAEPL